MRKFLATLLVLLLFSASAVAEGLNLAEMDDSNLLVLKKAVDTEYNSRLVSDPILLEPGTYIVGKDLRAGRWYARVNTYKAGIEAEAYLKVTRDKDSIHREYARLGDDSIIIDVSEGDTIEVSDFPMAFKQSEFDDGEIYKCETPDGVCVFPGDYKVGVQIPAGTYRVQIGPTGYTNIEVWKHYPADDSYHLKCNVYLFQYAPDRSALIPLEEGDRVSIYYNEAFMTREESNIKFTFD